MEVKQIAISLVFLIFIFPSLIDFALLSITSITNPSPDNIEKGIALIAESSIPWWIKPFEWLSEKSAYLMIGFLIFLTWIGVIKSR